MYGNSWLEHNFNAASPDLETLPYTFRHQDIQILAREISSCGNTWKIVFVAALVRDR